jgi:DNA-binding NtrC family response regulator
MIKTKDKTYNPDKLNILVVDDEIHIRKAITMCLEIEGYFVRSISNFYDAVEEVIKSSVLGMQSPLCSLPLKKEDENIT